MAWSYISFGLSTIWAMSELVEVMSTKLDWVSSTTQSRFGDVCKDKDNFGEEDNWKFAEIFQFKSSTSMEYPLG